MNVGRWHPGLAALSLLTVTACAAASIDDQNPFTGCYDATCVAAPQLVPGVPPLASITTYDSHTCALTAAGEAWCWGDNALGQLGDGTDQPRALPVRVDSPIRWTAIVAGSGFTCALGVDQQAYCWGTDATRQLGQLAPELCDNSRVGCSRSPMPVPGHRFTAIAAGTRHACGLDLDGVSWCWGFNILGETGSTEYGTTTAAPNRVPGAVALVTLDAGESFTCGLTAAGRAYCWGADNRGELGRTAPPCNSVYSFQNSCSATPIAVNTTSTFSSLSVGSSHSCALSTGGAAQCWGDNGQGQLGAGDYRSFDGAIPAQASLAFSTIDASAAATCGTPTSGPSVCWGLNLFGKLGIGSRLELSTSPLPISGGRRFTTFAGGAGHVCALTADGAAYCWGSGRLGQLGRGPMPP